jgi:small subunit ribosomal protein S7
MKLFNKWDFEGLEIRDPGLKVYICLDPIIVPSTGGRLAKKRFGRKKYNLVERLVNKLMVIGHVKANRKHIFTSGRNCGKKFKALSVVETAFDTIEKKTKKNPIQILIRAVEHAAPRAEVTTVEYGGIRSPVAVDTSPLRRVDMALGLIAKGAAQKSIKKPKTIEAALAEEILAASENDPKSFSVDKKTMMEKQSEASR